MKKGLVLQPFKLPTQDSWRVFRIMAELVEGFEIMTSMGPSVVVFGSSNPKPVSPHYYDLAEKVIAKIVKKGFGIITGGGPGLMERANKKAYEMKANSCGLCINLKTNEHPNPYLDREHTFNFRYFFVRKVMFVRYARAFVVFPGGYGTLDELFEALNLVQTEKIQPFPIYLVGKEYWKGLIEWLKTTVMEKHKNITPAHFKIFHLSDDPDEIADGIAKFCKNLGCMDNLDSQSRTET
jgi:uncharacterized protein (TIGR00730 family)